jgi:pyridoxal phosphate enzyme (YggS family)
MPKDYNSICTELKQTNTKLIAVSKTKPNQAIQELYELGQRDFGENKVQELVDKYEQLPKDIRWHLIGHLQTNKVKYIAPFVHLIHSVDSLKLLLEIEKQAAKVARTIPVLLQIHIAEEETKFGLDKTEVIEILEYYTAPNSPLQHIKIVGLMGIATNTDDMNVRQKEFAQLKQLFLFIKQGYLLNKTDFTELSMGMSDDYPTAIQEGSTMVRIGSLLFGKRY